MTHSDWDDGEEFPPAPVPAHERPWRHPSEVGMAAWAQSEPPLVIGRGLSMATGTVGIALAAAVLWALLPTHAGQSSVASVRSTIAVAGTGAFGGAGGVESALDETASTSTIAGGAPSALPAGASGTVDPSAQPSGRATTTLPLRPVPTLQVSYHTDAERGAVAVALHDGRLVVTTAAAVDGSSVELLTPDGGIERAEVLLVDAERGLAVLSPTAGSLATSFTVSVEVQPGDELTAWADTPYTFTVGSGGLADADCGPADGLPEGAPVTDADGNLVALCTVTAATDSDPSSSSALVSLAGLDGLRRALGEATPPTVWMGLMLTTVPTDDGGSAVVVSAVEPGGPAARAGLDTGDTLRTVGGVAVTSVADVTGVLALHQPGDVVAVVVECSDGTRIEASVELAPPKAAL